MVAWEWGGRKGWEGWITKGHEEAFVCDRYVYHLDCGDGFARVHICQNNI